MGALLGLLGRGGNKLFGVSKRTAFTGLSNPFKTKTGKALGLLTVGQGLTNIGAPNKEIPGMVTNTTSKYFGNNYGLNNF